MNHIREYLRKAGTVFKRAGQLQRVMARVDVLRFLWLTFLGSRRFRFFCPALSTFVTVRTRTTDLPVLEKIVLYHEYEMPFDFVPRTIIDAGANVGVASLYFAHRFPQARIVAVEPEASNFTTLIANCSEHPAITPLHGAMWNRHTNLMITEPDAGKWAFTINESPVPTSESIRAFTVPDIMDAHSFPTVDLLKLDIEGAERELFDASAAEWLPKVRVIAIELHDTIKPGCSEAFYARLGDFYFEQRLCGENAFIRLLGRKDAAPD